MSKSSAIILVAHVRIDLFFVLFHPLFLMSAYPGQLIYKVCILKGYDSNFYIVSLFCADNQMKIHIYSVILLESVLLCAIAYNLLKTTRRSAGIRILNDINYKLHVSSSSLSSSLSSASNIINSVTLYVKDINKSISFYSGGIGLQQVHRDGSNDDAAFCLLDDSLIKLKQITLLDAVDVGDVMTSLHLIDSQVYSV